MSSPLQQGSPHPEPESTPPEALAQPSGGVSVLQRRVRRGVMALLGLLAALLLALLFAAYQNPDLLIDFSNLLFCG